MANSLPMATRKRAARCGVARGQPLPGFGNVVLVAQRALSQLVAQFGQRQALGAGHGGVLPRWFPAPSGGGSGWPWAVPAQAPPEREPWRCTSASNSRSSTFIVPILERSIEFCESIQLNRDALECRQRPNEPLPMNSPCTDLRPTSPPAKSRPPLPLIVVGLALLIGGGYLGGRLWWRSQHLVETDNAFLAGHVHPVSTRVAGVVTEMHLQDNAAVKAGDVLLKLDARMPRCRSSASRPNSPRPRPRWPGWRSAGPAQGAKWLPPRRW